MSSNHGTLHQNNPDTIDTHHDTNDITKEKFVILQQTAQSDLATLGRVSHRLAMIPVHDVSTSNTQTINNNSSNSSSNSSNTSSINKLEQVLDKLLPKLLKRIGENHQNKQQFLQAGTSSDSGSASIRLDLLALYDRIHAKLVEILSHALKRVRDDPTCRLPCVAILTQLMPVEHGGFATTNVTSNCSNKNQNNHSSSITSTSAPEDHGDSGTPSSEVHVDPIMMNLSLLFLNLGVPRCSLLDSYQLLPLLLLCHKYNNDSSSITTTTSKTSRMTVTTMNHLSSLLLRCIGIIVANSESSVSPVSSSTTKSPPTTPPSNFISIESSSMEHARKLCCDNPSIGRAVFDLFLDILLYQPSTIPLSAATSTTTNSINTENSNCIPPCGMSQEGNERMLLIVTGGTSSRDTHSNSRRFLSYLKNAVVTFISPNRRFGLFLTTPSTNVSTSDDNATFTTDGHSTINHQTLQQQKPHTRHPMTQSAQSNQSTQSTQSNLPLPSDLIAMDKTATTASLNGRWDRLGVARTVALLVIASASNSVTNNIGGNNSNNSSSSSRFMDNGPSDNDISERAAADLKYHLESYQHSITTTLNKNSHGINNDITSDNVHSSTLSSNKSSMLEGVGGIPLAILPFSTSLLGLCLGETHAESIVRKIQNQQLIHKTKNNTIKISNDDNHQKVNQSVIHSYGPDSYGYRFYNYDNMDNTDNTDKDYSTLSTIHPLLLMSRSYNTLPAQFGDRKTTTPDQQQQQQIIQRALLSRRRRQVSENTATAIQTFVSAKVLDADPHIFDYYHPHYYNDNHDDNGDNGDNGNNDDNRNHENSDNENMYNGNDDFYEDINENNVLLPDDSNEPMNKCVDIKNDHSTVDRNIEESSKNQKRSNLQRNYDYPSRHLYHSSKLLTAIRKNAYDVQLFMELAIQSIQKVMLVMSSPTSTPLTTSSASSISSIGLSTGRAKPYIAASQLLNMLTIRLSNHYDSIVLELLPSRSVSPAAVATNEEAVVDRNHGSVASDILESIEKLLAQSLSIACTVLSPILLQQQQQRQQPHQYQRTTNTFTDGDGSITVRDYCYGVLCTLSRSQFALTRQGYMFRRGTIAKEDKQQQPPQHQRLHARSHPNNTTMVPENISIDTASLLFGCASNEVDRLRPRAVAALDALLYAYNRLLQHLLLQRQQHTNPTMACASGGMQMNMEQERNIRDTTNNNVILNTVETAIDYNPWKENTTATDSVIHQSTLAPSQHENSIEKISDNVELVLNSLATSLVRLVWDASQSYRSKTSRVAAARWAGTILKQLDVTQACHILCALAGDADPTASSIAINEGLGLATPAVPTTSNNTTIINENSQILLDTITTGSSADTEDIATLLLHRNTKNDPYPSNSNCDGDDKDVDCQTEQLLPEFSDFVQVMYPTFMTSLSTKPANNYPTFVDLSTRGKATTLRFTLLCLLNDLYGSQDDDGIYATSNQPIHLYFSAICDTMMSYCTNSNTLSILKTTATATGSNGQNSSSSLDLLEECSLCFLTVLSSSQYARKEIVKASACSDKVSSLLLLSSSSSPPAFFGFNEVKHLSVHSKSSRARRYLASACQILLDDVRLWIQSVSPALHEDITITKRTSNCNNESSTRSTHGALLSWIVSSQLDQILAECGKVLQAPSTIEAGTVAWSPSGSYTTDMVHGCAYLGANIVKVFRLQHQYQELQTTKLFEVVPIIEPKTKSIDSTLLSIINKNNDEADILVEKCWNYIDGIVTSLAKNTGHPDEIVGNACADGLAIAYSYHSRSRITESWETDDFNAPVLDRRLYRCTSLVLSNITIALKKFCHGDLANPSRAIQVIRAAGFCLAASTTTNDRTSSSASAQFVSSNDDNLQSLEQARLGCTNALIDALGSDAFRKTEDIAMFVGDALASYADSYSLVSDVSISWPPTGAVVGADTNATIINDISFIPLLTPPEQVLYLLLRKCYTSNSPHQKIACAPALLAVVSRGATSVNANILHKTSALSLSLLRHLDEIQSTFVALLSYPKSKQLSRESCCLGLAACRGLLTRTSPRQVSNPTVTASDRSHQRLLRAFGQTTNYGGSAMIETPAQAAARRAAEIASAQSTSSNNVTTSHIADQIGGNDDEPPEVGGTVGLGEAALGSYREMAAASVSLGREDVLYTLLVLSVSHPYWSTASARHRYNSSSLLGVDSVFESSQNALNVRVALRPHLSRLVPRILRACHDPNKQTRDQMNSLWIGLTGGGAEGRTAISNNLLPTLDTLLEDACSKSWRARVGACGALCEVITEREWSALGGGGPVLTDDDLYNSVKSSSNSGAGIRLLSLWRVAMRALDDVHGSVRDKGETLARAVRALSIRLSDSSSSNDKKALSGVKRGRNELKRIQSDATAAAATTLRWLIKHGLNQSCAEAVGISVSTLIEIIGVVKPKILEPILPDLLRSLLLAMSSLEPAALNYLQLRTTDEEVASNLERARLQLAQSGPLASGVKKCIELLPYVSSATHKLIAPELDTALRLSSGFATRVAVANAVSSICSTCPVVFRCFTGASSANPSVRLLRAFYYACERERGAGSMDKMIHALGHLAAHCPGSSIRSLALRACDRYMRSTGNSDDVSARKVAAASLRAIAVRASNQFADGGKNDIWRRRVLPAAYIGMKDTDSKIASSWKDVWEEGGSAANLSCDVSSMDFGTTLEEKLLQYLVNECVLALEDVSWTRRVAGASALSELCDFGVLSPILKSSSSLTETIARSRYRAESSHKAINACISLLSRPRLWSGKSTVMSSLSKLACKWIAADPADDSKRLVLLGWNDQESLCPWCPILVAPGAYEGDLLTGDRWFESKVEQLGIESESESHPLHDLNSDKKPDDDLDGNVLEDYGLDDDEVISDNIPQMVSTTSTAVEVATFTGLCQFLIRQAFFGSAKESQCNISDESLPYRVAALRAFRDLMDCLPTHHHSQRMEIFKLTFSNLISALTNVEGSSSFYRDAPVLIATAIDCIGSCFWEGIGVHEDNNNFSKQKQDDFIQMIKYVSGKTQPAWTVRESACMCMSRYVLRCHLDVLRQPNVVALFVSTASLHMSDPKFWRVRYAGLKILDSFMQRTGTGYDKTTEKQLALEALLPHKEAIIRATRKSLGDNESSVTALSSTILASIAWWP